MPALAGAALACSSAALAVGLGPLEKSGVTGSEAKGLYLTISNPYPQARQFHAFVEPGSGIDISRVTIHPAVSTIAGDNKRRILVIVHALEPGETVSFRLCAEKIEIRKVSIHARVCSRLGARRIGARLPD